jgi:hypothetical protein
MVSSVSPSDGALNVSISIDRITVRFDEDMDRRTMLSCVYYTDSAGVNQPVNFKAWGSSSIQLQFSRLLQPDETYYVHATTQCADIAGNQMEQEFISSFATEIANTAPLAASSFALVPSGVDVTTQTETVSCAINPSVDPTASTPAGCQSADPSGGKGLP